MLYVPKEKKKKTKTVEMLTQIVNYLFRRQAAVWEDSISDWASKSERDYPWRGNPYRMWSSRADWVRRRRWRTKAGWRFRWLAWLVAGMSEL